MLRQRHPPTLPPIPDDVWGIVARYLPPEELRRLYSVNRALFHLSLEERYRSICFSKGDKKMKWLCKNIKNDLVRHCVRSIEIRPWHIECKVADQQSRRFWGSMGQRLLQCVSQTDDQLSISAEEAYAQRKVTKAIKRMNNAMEQLPNVQEFKIKCMQSNCLASFVEGMIPCLMNWKNSLTKLTLCVPPDKLPRLARVELHRLESLELVFWSPALEQHYFRYIAMDPLVVFINNLYPTLQSLSVAATRCAVNVDLALLFKSLGTFPRMRNFELSMPYDGSSLSSIRPLLSFLARHKKIRSVKLSTKVVALRNAPTPIELKEWIPGILKTMDNSFGDIQDVNIALRPLKMKSTLTALIGFLTTHGQNLMSLTLTEDNSLSFQEVEEMFRMRTPYGFRHLQRLLLNVQRLSAELLSLLAETFPNLKELEIGFMYFSQGPEFDTFFDELIASQKNYQDWNLKRIKIPHGSGPALKWTPRGMQYVLMHCIPSLESVDFLPKPIGGSC